MAQKITKIMSTATTRTKATTITIYKPRQIQSLTIVELFLDSKQRKSNSIQTRQDVDTLFEMTMLSWQQNFGWVVELPRL